MNVFKKNPQVQNKMKNILDKYIKLSCVYQSNIGYDTLIQSVNLKELINLKGATIVDIDIELKLNFSNIKDLESELL